METIGDHYRGFSGFFSKHALLEKKPEKWSPWSPMVSRLGLKVSEAPGFLPLE
jgi:hypothetical protein